MDDVRQAWNHFRVEFFNAADYDPPTQCYLISASRLNNLLVAMDDAVLGAKEIPMSTFNETPRQLRWIERDGVRVLQQLWVRTPAVWNSSEELPQENSEWRDVPLVSPE